MPGPFLDREIREADDARGRRLARIRGELEEPKPLRTLKKPKGRYSTHLVIPDSHAHPDEPNHRFEWLGKLIMDVHPDVIIDIGDSADMPSLFGYESGNKGPIFEGKSYWRDLDAYHDAKDRLHWGMLGYKGKKVKCLGNHEDRIDRVVRAEPRFRSIISLKDLMDEDNGWEVVPFTEPISIDGVAYAHYFKAVGSRNPIAGVVQARAVVNKRPGSYCRVFGHNHKYQYYEEFDGDPRHPGRKVTSISCGLYSRIDSPTFDWAGEDWKSWRAGVLVLEVSQGQIRSHQWLDYDKIHQQYG